MPPRKPPPPLHVGEATILTQKKVNGDSTWVDKRAHVWTEVEEGGQEHKYWAMVSPSSQSECRQCGKKIEKGTARPEQNPRPALCGAHS